ncbi:MAG: WYL domain-containing protein, partial [Acidobacteria bacterium]|nr:WYL domain-containing protein [Acidobacteriota bacterium]
TARFEREIQRGTAVVRATSRGLKQLRGTGFAVGAAIDAAHLAKDREGRFRVAIPIESVEHAAATLLPLGAEVEVLEPVALRARLVAMAEAVLRAYGAGAMTARTSSKRKS